MHVPYHSLELFRNMKLVHLATVFVTVVYLLRINVCHGSGNNKSLIEAVLRRTDSDLYYVYPTKFNGYGYRCDQQQTYMIEERRCMMNEDLFKGE